MKGVILCAGKGERLRPLTDDIPKPLIPVAGIPLLAYNLALLKEHGINHVCINTSYLPGKVRSAFGDGSQIGMNIEYSFEPELLGTAGALNNFRASLKGEPFFVIYGDNLTNLDLTAMASRHNSSGSIATIFLRHEDMPDSKTTPGVVVTREDGLIEQIIERPTEKQMREISQIPESRRYNNAGIYLLSPRILDYIRPGFSDFASEIFPFCIDNGERLQGFTSDCFYRELGSLGRYEGVNGRDRKLIDIIFKSMIESTFLRKNE